MMKIEHVLLRDVVTVFHVIEAMQELYGDQVADKVTGRAIERAGYTLPGSAPVLPAPVASHERARAASPAPAKVMGMGIPITDDVLGYIARYGGQCRDCDDTTFGPICDGSGLPCGERRGIEHVLRALNYGLEHGYIAATPAPPPEPAKAEVVVKPLEWRDRGEGVHPQYVADTVVGGYFIHRTKGGAFQWWTPALRGKVEVHTLEVAKAAAQADYERRILSALSTTPTAPVVEAKAIHPDDIAVDGFAKVMSAKIASKRALGYGGWDDRTRCSNEHLSQLLHSHVDKGDPVDVANFAMMLHQRGERILSVPTAPAAARSAADWREADLETISLHECRQAAEEMRERCAKIVEGRADTTCDDVVFLELTQAAEDIRALPLTGEEA